MKNGQLKAGCNVQIATEGQYILAYDIFSNQTDTRTLIPFFDTTETHFFKLPEFIVADAGYDSEQNYENILENRNRTPLITYNQYRKEKEKKHIENTFHVDNWEYNGEEDAYPCSLAIIPNERTGMDLHVNLKCTNVRTVQPVHYVTCVRKQKQEKTAKSTLMKSGNLKKNMYARGFRSKKLVKFTANVKLMSSQFSDF